jgi:hypothetical protein
MPVNEFAKEKGGASFACAREHGTVLIARNDYDRRRPIQTSGTYLLGQFDVIRRRHAHIEENRADVFTGAMRDSRAAIRERK